MKTLRSGLLLVITAFTGLSAAAVSGLRVDPLSRRVGRADSVDSVDSQRSPLPGSVGHISPRDLVLPWDELDRARATLTMYDDPLPIEIILVRGMVPVSYEAAPNWACDGGRSCNLKLSRDQRTRLHELVKLTNFDCKEVMSSLYAGDAAKTLGLLARLLEAWEAVYQEMYTEASVSKDAIGAAVAAMTLADSEVQRTCDKYAQRKAFRPLLAFVVRPLGLAGLAILEEYAVLCGQLDRPAGRHHGHAGCMSPCGSDMTKAFTEALVFFKKFKNYIKGFVNSLLPKQTSTIPFFMKPLEPIDLEYCLRHQFSCRTLKTQPAERPQSRRSEQSGLPVVRELPED